MIYHELKTVLEVRIKTKRIHRVLEFNQSQWLKQYVEFNTQKVIEAETNGVKDGRALFKLMNNAAYGKTMENFRKRIDVRFVSNKSKMNIQTKLYVAQNIWQ